MTGLALAALTTAGVTGAAPAPQPAASSSFDGFVLASAIAPIAPTALAAPSSDTETTAADDTLAAAEATLASAASVSTDIQSSGLDLGVPDASVDTASLQAAVDRLHDLDGALEPFAPAAADQVAALVAPVDARVSELRGALDGAKQRKADEEAAERARAEAEAEAAAAAAQVAKPTTATPATRPAATMSGGSAGEAQAIARDMVAARGWGDDQFGCLVALWNRESGWNYAASNPSGAYGIPQALPGSKMASAGGDWQTNPATQISWGLGYISGRYGAPCAAWDHSESAGWY